MRQTTLDTYNAAKAAATAAANAANAAEMRVGRAADGRTNAAAAAAEMDIQDVAVRGRLFEAWSDGRQAAAEALFARILPVETIGSAVSAAADLESVRFAVRGEEWSEMYAAVNPYRLAAAYVRGHLPSSDRIDAAAKAASALARFFGVGRHEKGAKPATRSEKAKAALEWSEAFKRMCLTESERLEADRLAAEAAAAAEALAKAEAAFAAEAAKANKAAAAAAAKAAKLQTALAEAMAEAEAAAAAAAAEALAALKA